MVVGKHIDSGAIMLTIKKFSRYLSSSRKVHIFLLSAVLSFPLALVASIAWFTVLDINYSFRNLVYAAPLAFTLIIVIIWFITKKFLVNVNSLVSHISWKHILSMIVALVILIAGACFAWMNLGSVIFNPPQFKHEVDISPLNNSTGEICILEIFNDHGTRIKKENNNIVEVLSTGAWVSQKNDCQFFFPGSSMGSLNFNYFGPVDDELTFRLKRNEAAGEFLIRVNGVNAVVFNLPYEGAEHNILYHLSPNHGAGMVAWNMIGTVGLTAVILVLLMIIQISSCSLPFTINQTITKYQGGSRGQVISIFSRKKRDKTIVKTSESRHTRTHLIVGLCLALFTIILLLCLEAYFRPAAPDVYFQEWSSETMMQTVSIEDLRDKPLQSLWFLHIQPPMFDAIRAILAQVWRLDDSKAMLLRVDSSLYILWALIYGMIVFLIFWWLSEMTSTAFAAISTLVFSVHPAFIFYATLLDTTLLSTFLILSFSYALWRVREARNVSVGVLALLFLLLFFTRSIFQWQWLLFLPLPLVLMRFPLRKLIVFLTITGIVVGLYTAKQMSLFGLSSTSSFTGYNLCNSIGCTDTWAIYNHESAVLDQEPPPEKPDVLTRVRKVNGSVNFNNEHYLTVHRELKQQFSEHFLSLSSSPLQLVKNYLVNLRIYLRPSSQYGYHVIVDRLPQRSVYDYLFSAPIFPQLLNLAFLFWLSQARRSDHLQRVIGFCLPVAFIAFLCIVGERGEDMRYKFFIEPILFIFLASQVYAAGKKMIACVE